ncbi:MAG TPA: TerC family protein [Longimicrobium sp.]|nr:TerC family protein [Longimicrobium sp.]
MSSYVFAWAGFVVMVLVLLAIDLGVFNRKAHEITVKEAGRWSLITVILAMLFAGLIWSNNVPTDIVGGPKHALEFLTGYLIELALSVDNIFVFVLIFSYFSVPTKYQHRVLFWGILGALVFRGVMIGAGAVLIERFHWIIYVFGAFLVFTGIRMATQNEIDIEPEANPALKLVRRFLPVTTAYDGQNFFTHETINGKLRRAATPLFVVLVLVETTDLIFAVDSIPAIFAVTTNPFIVFTSNVFAILCLRSLYFLLAGVIDRFHYLKLGLSVVLVFIGAKMLATFFDIHVNTLVSLLVVAGVLIGSVVLSLLRPPDPHVKEKIHELEEGGVHPERPQTPAQAAETISPPVVEVAAEDAIEEGRPDIPLKVADKTDASESETEPRRRKAGGA